ncbi:molybdopterin oxidoreductase family protein [Dongia soli]|uniref:Molybdopterin oxidoreductase family protein n=1 Tax=Dongia soli TaxID=600628 RepID=A0ABU5EFM4_9PROT|nr:molybdopterin oxidoreductase family protein [Dongia soli]MDY0885208.1 molybdopterin oxidoreductase family protein [Dongia soli]
MIDTAPVVHDRVAYTTCYMCACRCGIKVHLQDGQIRYIEGNRDHPVNKGVLCAKGSAGIMTQNSPAKLKKPLLRVGERGQGEFKEIEWEEALALASDWLGQIRATDPKRLAFFTGRDQSQALTGWWATQFGTPNYAAHGGFCSVNMAAGGLYSIGGSFWEFGEPDWHRTRYFMLFGVAEDHDSNPIKLGLGHLKGRTGDDQAKFVSVNPVRTGYSAIADEWIGLAPGTDGLFVLALVHELLRNDKIDLDFLVRYTNAAWLIIDAPGSAEHGLFARDAEGAPLCCDHLVGHAVNALLPGVQPRLIGRVTLPEEVFGAGRQARPVFDLLAETYLDPAYAPENVALRIGISAETIRRIAAELAEAAFEQQIELPIEWTDWAGRRHDKVIGRPVSMHAMRGISAHSNGFQTCRAIHLLQMLLGSIDCPGGFRYKPPFPRPVPPPVKPAWRSAPDQPLPGPPLGFPEGPEDLLVDDAGKALRIDKAYSWEAPLAAHGLMHMVIHNAWAGDPYPIDTLFLYMANMAWNSAMNTTGTMRMLTDKDPETGAYRIPHIIYADAYYSETVAYADLVLPDTTYLERHDCISLLDRPICDAEGMADSIRQPVIELDRDVRPFQDVLLDLGARLKLPGMVKQDGTPLYPGGLKDYMVHHQRKPGIGMLAGWRGADGSQHGKGEPNPDQLQRYIENGCFWRAEIPESARYLRHANHDYFDWAISMGLMDRPEQIVLQLYSEPLQRFRLAAEGHGEGQPPESERERLLSYFDPLPIWYAPFGQNESEIEFPLHAITQRPMHMYHSWGSQNAWLRQIQSENKLYIHHATAARLGLKDGDWVWVESEHGGIKAPLQLMDGVNPDTVWTWNAIGKRAGAWNLKPEAGEAQRGFLLNHVISELLPPRPDGYRYANADPVTGQAAWYDLKVRLRKCEPGEERLTEPRFSPLQPPLPAPAETSRYGRFFRRKREKAGEGAQ